MEFTLLKHETAESAFGGRPRDLHGADWPFGRGRGEIDWRHFGNATKIVWQSADRPSSRVGSPLPRQHFGEHGPIHIAAR